jgi:hypothetical protein
MSVARGSPADEATSVVEKVGLKIPGREMASKEGSYSSVL